jgi:hypothetical protein
VKDDERLALSRVQLNLAVKPDDVWSPMGHHVGELHQGAAREVLDRFAEAERGGDPIGIVLEGEAGVGKTHMLRWLRHEVKGRGGYFFLLKFLEGGEFWHSALHGFVSGFFPGQDDQLTPLLHALCTKAGITDPYDRQQLCGPLEVSRAALDAFIDGLRDYDRQCGTMCEDTARAMVLFRARGRAGEAGRDYFALDGGGDAQRRAEWGLRRGSRPPQEILAEISRLVALVGPAVVAVDQLDSLMVQSNPPPGKTDDVPLGLVNQVADGLMELRELTRRTMPVVACIPDTWDIIRTRAVASAADRYTRTW